MAQKMEPAEQHMRSHVLEQLAQHRSRFTSDTSAPPLFVGVQGPQGSGKTYLTSRLQRSLSSAPDSLSVVVLSIDDLYLPHDRLIALAETHPQNALLRGRGQPGTHDVGLGTTILDQLKHINDAEGADLEVRIPRFDKSLYGGEGDRVPDGTVIRGPVDVVIMEGWCVGFYPISEEELDRRWELPVIDLQPDFFRARGFKKEDVLEINAQLHEYVHWWAFFDAFIQLKPIDSHPYSYIYKWRLEQEHYMKANNGGRGMTDDQVISFVDRYIPGYVFFGDGIRRGGPQKPGSDEQQRPPWIGKGLEIQIGERREVISVSHF